MHPYIVMVRTDIRSDILFIIPDNPNNLNLQSSGTNDAPIYPLNTPVTLVLRVLRHIQDDCAVATITPQQRRPYPPPQYKEGYFCSLSDASSAVSRAWKHRVALFVRMPCARMYANLNTTYDTDKIVFRLYIYHIVIFYYLL